MEFVVLGVEWVEGQPFLLTTEGDDNLLRPAPIAGFDLHYRALLDRPRVCLGHSPSIGDDVCDKPVPAGSRTCQRCSIKAAMHASDLHHAHTKPGSGALTGHLDQPNLLYLAAFGDGSIKIGTSTAHRIHTRLLEQGAMQARIVGATEDGIRIRVLEDVVTETLGIAQTVGIGRKIAGLANPRPAEFLETLLADNEEKVHGTLENMAKWERRSDPWVNPAGNEWDTVFSYPNDLGAGAHQLVASGAYGRIVQVHRPVEGADRFVADIKRLFGIRLERGTFQTPDVAAQHSLF